MKIQTTTKDSTLTTPHQTDTPTNQHIIDTPQHTTTAANTPQHPKNTTQRKAHIPADTHTPDTPTPPSLTLDITDIISIL